MLGISRDLPTAVLTPRSCAIYAVAQVAQLPDAGLLRLYNYQCRPLSFCAFDLRQSLHDRRPTHTMTSAYITLPPHRLSFLSAIDYPS